MKPASSTTLTPENFAAHKIQHAWSRHKLSAQNAPLRDKFNRLRDQYKKTTTMEVKNSEDAKKQWGALNQLLHDDGYLNIARYLPHKKFSYDFLFRNGRNRIRVTPQVHYANTGD